MHRRTKLVAALASTTGLLSLAGPPLEASTSCFTSKRAEKRFATKINGARIDAGVRRLVLDPELSFVARRHTRNMIARGGIYHSSDRWRGSRVTNWLMLGENVGAGATVRRLHRMFMRSKAHADNVLLPAWTYVGVGTRWHGGRLWVTVLFESRYNPGTTLAMPGC